MLSLANILHCPITSISDMLIICMTPTVETMDTTIPIFLTFIQIPIDEDTLLEDKPTAGPTTRCTCGRKADFQGKAYRCPCMRSNRSLCRCKCCANVHVRPPPSKERRRIAYDTKRQPLCGQTTFIYGRK